jgi:hypothetical protein
MSAAGFTTLTLVCQDCGERFSLLAATGKAPAKLDDPFPATCPHCGDQSTYPKTSIEVLRAE